MVPQITDTLRPGEMLTLNQLKAIAGLGRKWLMAARADGLKVSITAGKLFIASDDVIQYIAKQANDA